MKKIVKFALFLTITFAGFTTASGAESKRPNVVYILADDLGYESVPKHNPGCIVPMPNID